MIAIIPVMMVCNGSETKVYMVSEMGLSTTMRYKNKDQRCTI
jgi:hypothetical protein